MNCANHPDVAAVAYCRTCGKPLCNVCARDVRGVVYCEDCLASHVTGATPSSAWTAAPAAGQPAKDTPRPALAAILGLIPGVGAMYNGEFAKGFIHVLIFATLIWMAQHGSPAFGILIAAFYIYMPIEAYKTARARELGLPAPDPLGLNNIFRPDGPRAGTSGRTANLAPVTGSEGTAAPDAPLPEEPQSRAPTGALILIAIGVILLLDEFGVFNFDWGKIWPIILIVIGGAMLYRRRRAC